MLALCVIGKMRLFRGGRVEEEYTAEIDFSYKVEEDRPPNIRRMDHSWTRIF